MPYQADVLLDSVSPAGHRLTTFVLRFPRFVLPEFNTHRMFSRNASSSRAIPTTKLIQQLREDPVEPVEWGRNQAGMQARDVLPPADAATAAAVWHEARESALHHAERLRAIGVHKQIVNRVLEPWMWASVIVSATSYENFFTLRCHPDAQPEIKRLADLMRDAYRASEPTPKRAGEWHLPFVREADDLALPLDVQKRVSVARAARVSYLNHAGTRDVEADLVLHQRLLEAGHWSPFEHAAMAAERDAAFNNFVGWQAYRWQMEQERLMQMAPAGVETHA